MSGTLAGKRVLVTGATGFIGGHLARRLHNDGAHVLALERRPGSADGLRAAGIEVVRGDITDRQRMAEIVAQGVEVVMHIAAWLGRGDVKNAYPVNVTATRDLAEVSAAAGVERFVFTSSISVYGIRGGRDVDETTPLKLFNYPYGDTKIQAEAALRQVAAETGLKAVIVRPGMVYGPGSPTWTARLARWAKKGRMPLLSGGGASAFPIYIDNLLDLLVLAATHPAAPGETFNAVDDGPITMRDFLGAYMAMVPTTRAIRVPCWLARTAAFFAEPFFKRYRVAYIISQLCEGGQISNQKAKDVLGWEPRVSLHEGLRRSEAWLRAEGIL
ncbi:MAG TPA: SDR family NAD(P)-dependent oxidoreductase [Aggregatilineales bacterium]|nr:SDR family NAD(P)-dependent oxidoreductase [Aggregatilineales bacterium]